MAVNYNKLWKLLIDKICSYLDCNIEDVVTIIKE